MLQYKPRGGDGPMYAPQRDLAHITPTLMQSAISRFDVENMEPALRAELTKHGISDEILLNAVRAFAESQRMYVYQPGIRGPHDAFAMTGFDQVPVVLQNIILATIGGVLVGAWFEAVRTVTIVGEETPAAQEVAALTSVGRELVRRGGYPVVPPHPQEQEVEALRHRAAALHTKVEQLLEQLERLQQRKPSLWQRILNYLRK